MVGFGTVFEVERMLMNLSSGPHPNTSPAQSHWPQKELSPQIPAILCRHVFSLSWPQLLPLTLTWPSCRSQDCVFRFRSNSSIKLWGRLLVRQELPVLSEFTLCSSVHFLFHFVCEYTVESRWANALSPLQNSPALLLSFWTALSSLYFCLTFFQCPSIFLFSLSLPFSLLF